MTQPDTLHARLEAEIRRRLEVARAATPGPWSRYGNLGFAVFTEAYDVDYEPPAVTHGSDREADAEHIALHDPADAVRRYEGELEVLERHVQILQANWSAERDAYVEPACRHCQLTSNDGDPLYRDWPCSEITSLAHRLGVSVDGR